MINLPGLKLNEPLSLHTTFKIGGPAQYFYKATSTKDLVAAIKQAQKHDLPCLVIGHGSNILVSDQGIKGLVIHNQTQQIKLKPNHQAELDSGVFLPKAIFYLINQGLTGLEVFSGIPATVGGATAVKMHGVDCNWEDFIVSVNRYEAVILSVVLQLQSGDKAAALAKAKAIQFNKRHQPQQSAGCIFKNPPGQSAGAIIDNQLKLKGTKIGQAQISVKHANFIENLGQATAADVIKLIQLVKSEAKEKLNLNLELEIGLLGF